MAEASCDNAGLLARRAAAVPRGLAQAAPIFVDRARNAELWDVEGRRYIDFAGGIGVLNTGHCHERITAAVRDQLDRFTHSAAQVVGYALYVELAERLNAIAPIAGPAKTILFTTGAEAVENGVKIARVATGRPAVLAFTGAFHGRTLFTLGLTGKVDPYKRGFGPFPPEIHHIPFPADDGSVGESFTAIERLARSTLPLDQVAAIVIEPVQGEGGFNVAPPALMTGLRTLCDAHGMLLIADEVQSGFGRTGRMFAMEHYGVTPDLVVMAKSLAGGFPLSALTGRAAVMDAPEPGGLGGTYGGNPLACAAALAVLEVMAEEDFLARAGAMEDQVRDRLSRLAADPTLGVIRRVRGLGAMLAFDLVDPGEDGPSPKLARAVAANACEAGLLLLTCGVHGNTVRILAPLTADAGVMAEGLDMLEGAVRRAVADAG